MAKKQVKHTHKKLSPEEDAQMQRKVAQEDRDMPANQAKARQFFDEHARLRELIALLKAERQRQGLTLSEVGERIQMDPAALSRLETNDRVNPTLDTVQQLAHALGKQIRVELVDEAA